MNKSKLNFKKGFTLKASKGFTLIELLLVISIVAILTTIILSSLNSGKTKANDSKTISQISQMTSQAFLFSGTVGTAYVVPTPYKVSNGITGASSSGTAGSGTLFNATNISLNSLYLLADELPGDNYIYYGWDGVAINPNGRWFFISSTSTGAFCNDYKGSKKTFTGVPPTTLSNFTTAFPNATALGGYRCD